MSARSAAWTLALQPSGKAVTVSFHDDVMLLDSFPTSAICKPFFVIRGSSASAFDSARPNLKKECTLSICFGYCSFSSPSRWSRQNTESCHRMATQPATEECDHRFKLLLIGDSGVVILSHLFSRIRRCCHAAHARFVLIHHLPCFNWLLQTNPVSAQPVPAPDDDRLAG